MWRSKGAATGVVIISPQIITDLMTERFDEGDIASSNAHLCFWLQWAVLVSQESAVFWVGVQQFRRCVCVSETGLGYLILVDGSRATRRTEYHQDRPWSGQLDLSTSQTLQSLQHR